MGKMITDVDCSQQARNRLIELKSDRTWFVLAQELGINQGYLHRVATGKCHASRRLIAALQIPKPKRRTYDLTTKKAREIGMRLYIAI